MKNLHIPSTVSKVQWIFFKDLFVLFYVDGVLPKCMPAHYLCALCLRRPEEDFRTPSAGVTGRC